MKAALTLALAASLVTSSLPADAQFIPPPAPPRYPLRPPVRSVAPPNPPARTNDWSRVRALPPGSRISVMAVGLADENDQYFISATEQSLTLLTPEDRGLPRAARRFVVKTASRHPELFTTPDSWVEYDDGNVRVNPDGVFVRGRKAADLGAIARTFDAGDVAEVRRPSRDYQETPEHNPEVEQAAFGLGLGAALIAARLGAGPGVGFGLLIGVPVAVAAIAARHVHLHRANELVYRAP